jgi:hypothetical protein
MHVTAPDSAAPLLRRGLLWLGGLTTIGIVVELLAERHWSAGSQWVAWAIVAVGVGALILAAVASSHRAVMMARILAVAVIAGSVFGIWEHIESNHEAGELDQVYSASWESLPASQQWWLAVSKTVGPSPPFAPAALAQAGVCVLLATVKHPALARRRGDSPVPMAV